MIDVGVTTSCSGLPLAAPGIGTMWPFSFATRFCGLLALTPSRRTRDGRLVNGSRGPWGRARTYFCAPPAEPARTSSQESPFVAVKTSRAIGRAGLLCRFLVTVGPGELTP